MTKVFHQSFLCSKKNKLPKDYAYTCKKLFGESNVSLIRFWIELHREILGEGKGIMEMFL